jgi:crotonobetaine/carnitine-CoA ligase
VLPIVLERRAAEHPDRTFAVFEDGRSWTYQEAADAMSATAHALAALGVDRGDTVVSWMPNTPESLRTWFGCGQLGAIFVPVNTAYKGMLLEHVLRNSGARVAVVHADLVPRMADIDRSALEHVIVVGASEVALPGITMHAVEALDSGIVKPYEPTEPVESWDTQAIMYTSGTTGPSKGVLSSHLHLYTNAVGITVFDGVGPRADERFLINYPLFHIGGTIPIAGMVYAGASIAVDGGFNTSSFWSSIRGLGITRCWMTGIMATFVLKEPAKADDLDNPLEMVVVGPLDEATKEFLPRFGVNLRSMFNMTESNMPVVSVENPTVPGTSGQLRPGCEARIVDAHDREVPVGEIGELILRDDVPWALMHGYHGMPEATATAWRNGWFHTGDAMRRDEAGNYFYADRFKDSIRRRGENVSSFEVERELLAHPAIREAAAVAVPSELIEDDILAVIALLPGATIDHAELIGFLEERMAYFMVPRYIRILDTLPMTDTGKVQKYVVRDEGVTPDTWDRDKAGIRLRRERLSS